MKLATEIHPHPPFDFAVILEYLRTSPSTILEEVDDVRYRRVVSVGDVLTELTLSATGTGAEPILNLELAGGDLEEHHVAVASALTRKVFDTQRDTSVLAELACRDRTLGKLITRFPGMRPIMIAEPFEALLWAVIGQQVNTSFARKNKLALIEVYGEEVELNGRSFRLFPSPERLARLAERELRPLQFSIQKESYIRGIAQAVVEGKLDFAALSMMEAKDAVEVLTHLRGVGRWTAEYMALRGLGHIDVIPAADGGLRRIIGLSYWGRRASEEEVRGLAERWRGWRGYAAFYWWLALQKGLAG